MGAKLSFFARIFITVMILSTTLLLATSTIFGRLLLTSSETQIGEMQMKNTESLPKRLTQLSEGLRRDALYLSLLLGNPRAGQSANGKKVPVTFLRETYETLAGLSRTNPSLFTTYIYFDDIDYVVSSRAGAYPLAGFLDREWYEPYLAMPTEEKEAWLPPREIQPSVNMGPSNQGGVALSYLFRIPPYTTTGLSGAFLFNLKESYVAGLINDDGADALERVVILSGEGRVISDVNKGNIGADQSGEEHVRAILDSADAGGFLLREIDGSQMVVSYSKAGFQDWIFVEYASVDSIQEAFANNMRTILIVVTLVLAAGCVGTYFISKRIYHPVKELTEELSRGGRMKGAGHGELMLLRTAISRLIAEEEELRRGLERNSASVEEIFLRNMVHEGVSELEAPGDIAQRFRRTTVAVLLSDDSSVSVLRSCEADRRFYLRNLMLQLVGQIVLEEGMLHTGFFLKNDALVFLHYPEGASPDYGSLVSRFSQYAEYLSENLQISVTIGVSEPFVGTSGIHEAYGETVAAARRKLFSGYRQVILVRDVPAVSEYTYPLEEEAALIAAIQRLEYSEIEARVSAFFQAVHAMSAISVDHTLLILYQLTGSIYKCLLQLGIRDSFFILQAERLLADSHTTSYLSLEEYESSLKKQLHTLMLSIRESSRRSTDMFSQMMSYIMDNYRRDVSIEEVAEYLGISYSYSRRIFKDNTGKNMLDYVNELRILESKEMLLKTDAPIARVAVELGYNNDQSFVRYFKKFTGTSPGNFRKAHCPPVK